MCGLFRKQIIASHHFYIEQARKRLLSQFQNIGEESDKYADEWLNKAGQYFDPDRHDPGDFEEQAYFKSIEFHHMLEDMLNRTRLSVVSGIFHEWEKQLKRWIIKNVDYWHDGDNLRKEIWKSNFGMIIDLLHSLGWMVRENSYYKSLDRCRLVVNCYKHGGGNSFEEIKNKHHDFIMNFEKEQNDYMQIKIDENQIAEFSDAIIEFWNDVPEYIWNKDNLNLPNWFEKAINKDQIL
jgi:hypothetical protein